MITEKDCGKVVYFIAGNNFNVKKGILQNIVNSHYFGKYANISFKGKNSDKFFLELVDSDCFKNIFCSKRQMLRYMLYVLDSCVPENNINLVLDKKPIFIITENDKIEYGIIIRESTAKEFKINRDKNGNFIFQGYDVPSYEIYDMVTNREKFVKIDGSKIYNSIEEIIKEFSRKINEL